MKNWHSLSVLCVLMCFSVAGFGLGGDKAPAKKQTVANKSKWINVKLPFRPFEITAVGDAMWLCGVDETIAMSLDGGATWKVMYQKPDGEVLTKIEFVDALVGHASGTGGLLLGTIDGGKTWSEKNVGGSLQMFSFSGPEIGIALIGGALKTTEDGGSHWQAVDVMQNDAVLRKFTDVLSVAALSSTHMLAAIREPNVEERYLSTMDGGKTWNSIHVPNTIANELFIHDGEYWAFGIEYLGREHNPSGGYSVPVALHSTDGQKWEHGVRPTWEFNGCTVQGCVLPYGVVEVMYGDAEKTWALPQDLPTTAKFAMDDGRACVIDDGLRCGSAIASDAPQSRPENDGITAISIPGEHTLMEDCLECRFGNIPVEAASIGRGGSFRASARFTVNRNGTVYGIAVIGLPRKVSDSISRDIAHWLFIPAHEGTTTIAQKRDLQFVVSCFPGFPGHPEAASCSVIAGHNATPRLSVTSQP